MVEIMIAIVVVSVIAAFGAYGFMSWRRLREDQVLIARAAGLDQAQLTYLARHPGHSLNTPGADAEIRATMADLLKTGGASDDPAIDAIAGNVSFDTSVRPARVTYQGRSLSFPIQAGGGSHQ